MSVSTDYCSHCLNSEDEIAVKGKKYLDNGSMKEYLICQSCCVTLRHYHFNDEHEKSRDFWTKVWDHLDLTTCLA